MALNFPNGFNITSQEAIDARIIMSKAEMLTVKESRMPDLYFALCTDDGKMYLYNSANENDSETGKFRTLTYDIDTKIEQLEDGVESCGEWTGLGQG